MMSALSQKAESVGRQHVLFIEKLSALEMQWIIRNIQPVRVLRLYIRNIRSTKPTSYQNAFVLIKRFLASYDDRIKDSGTRAMRLTGISNSVRSSMILLRCARNMRQDGETLELRPYMLCGEPELWKLEKVRRYRSFKKLLSMLLDKKEVYARGKIKGA